MTTPGTRCRLTAHHRVTGPAVVAAFRAAAAAHGVPASTLTDNGMVFTTRFSGGRGGRNGLETELRRLGIRQKNGRPNHPQTQGKVERFQADPEELAGAPSPPSPLTSPSCRPSWTLSPPSTTTSGRTGPCRTGPPRPPPSRTAQSCPRRPDRRHPRPGPHATRSSTTGNVTLRTGGRLHHIGVGRTYAGTRVLLLVQDLHIRIIDAATGELLRELTLDLARDYQPTGQPPGPQKENDPEPDEGSRCPDVLRHRMSGGCGVWVHEIGDS